MHILTLVCYYQSGKNTQIRNLSNELKIICEMLALKIVMDPLRLTANVKVTTFLGSIPASWGAADKAVLMKVLKKFPKNLPESLGIYF